MRDTFSAGVLTLLILFGPNLYAQSTTAPSNTTPQGSQDKTAANSGPSPSPNTQNVGPSLEDKKTTVQVLMVSSALCLVGGSVSWMLSFNGRSDYDAASAAYNSSNTAANKSVLDKTATSYLLPLGIGGGLILMSGILALIGFSTGNGGNDFQRVKPSYDPEGPQLIGIDGIKDGAQPSPSPAASPAAK